MNAKKQVSMVWVVVYRIGGQKWQIDRQYANGEQAERRASLLRSNGLIVETRRRYA